MAESDRCKVSIVLSRVCERGTMSCTVYHAAPPLPTVQPSDLHDAISRYGDLCWTKGIHDEGGWIKDQNEPRVTHVEVKAAQASLIAALSTHPPAPVAAAEGVRQPLTDEQLTALALETPFGERLDETSGVDWRRAYAAKIAAALASPAKPPVAPRGEA